MTKLKEIAAAAARLPDAERARLASRLLISLPGVLSDSDEGVAEARRRDAELSASKGAGVSLAELKRALGR